MNQPNRTRRELHFENLDQILTDAVEITSGGYTTTGQWTGAQIITHVAGLIGVANRGADFAVPLPLRIVGRLLKPLHARPLKPGITMPKMARPSLAPPTDTTLDQAITLLRNEVNEANNKPMSYPSPIFGRLTHDQWVALHCRHAELHFSFIRPASEGGG